MKLDLVPEVGAPPVDSSDRLRPRSVSELRAMHAPRWLVRLVIQRRALVLVWGASGSAKTFLVLDLACSIARQIAWFGRRVAADGGVVYVAGEGHLKHRVEAYIEAHQLRDGDLSRIRFVTAGVNIFEAGADLLPLVTAIQDAATDLGGISFVVLDTLNSMMPGGDENSSEDMGAMIAAAKTIIAQVGCTVAFVHHAGKAEGSGARGHSSLRAAVDTELVVRDVGTHRTVTIEKQRDGETGTEFAFKLRPIDLGAVDDPEADRDERESSCVIEPLDAPPSPEPRARKRDVALDSLKEVIVEHGTLIPESSTIPAGTRGARIEQWLDRWRLRTGDDYGNDDTATSAFRRERKKLVDAGAVVCSGTWVWLS